MDTSFTWKFLTAVALVLRLTQENKVSKAAVNAAPVVKPAIRPLNLVERKAAPLIS